MFAETLVKNKVQLKMHKHRLKYIAVDSVSMMLSLEIDQRMHLFFIQMTLALVLDSNIEAVSIHSIIHTSLMLSQKRKLPNNLNFRSLTQFIGKSD